MKSEGEIRDKIAELEVLKMDAKEAISKHHMLDMLLAAIDTQIAVLKWVLDEEE